MGTSEALLVVVLALMYALMCPILALGWQQLLGEDGEHLGRTRAISIYGISQIGKYLPGNVFHFVGRQALGGQAGVKGAVLAISTAWEIVLQVFSGIAFAALLLPLFVSTVTNGGAVLIFALLTSLLGTALAYRQGVKVACAFAAYVTFLMFSATLFCMVLGWLVTVEAVAALGWPLLVGGYAMAWLIGFMTPGAPAGLGIRETVLLLLFDTYLPAGGLLAAVVLGRAVTTCGDFLFYLGARAIAVRPS